MGKGWSWEHSQEKVVSGLPKGSLLVIWPRGQHDFGPQTIQ